MIYYVCENESKNFSRSVPNCRSSKDEYITCIFFLRIRPTEATLPWTYSYFTRSQLLFGTARTVQDMDFGDTLLFVPRVLLALTVFLTDA